MNVKTETKLSGTREHKVTVPTTNSPTLEEGGKPAKQPYDGKPSDGGKAA